MTSRKISIIIPTLNEEEAISRTLSAIPDNQLNEMGYDVEVVVVDGGSGDRTRELAAIMGAKVVVEPKRGYGVPIRTGFRNSTGDIIAKADGDSTYPIEALPQLIRIMNNEKLDFVTTDRLTLLDSQAMSFRNRFGNTLLSVLVRVFFNLNMRDTQSGMWIIRKEALNRLTLKSNLSFSQEIKIEVCHFARLNWKEVAIRYRPRIGKAKFGSVRLGFFLVLALLLLRVRPRHGSPRNHSKSY